MERLLNYHDSFDVLLYSAVCNKIHVSETLLRIALCYLSRPKYWKFPVQEIDLMRCQNINISTESFYLFSQKIYVMKAVLPLCHFISIDMRII